MAKKKEPLPEEVNVAPENNDENEFENEVIYGSDESIGRVGPIGKEQVDNALSMFNEYKSSKSPLELRIVENEQWWRIRHWEAVGKVKGKEQDPEPASAWLFNSVINKHADAMDNFPTPNFLPREKSDEEVAKRLQKIIPCILDANNFEQTYSDAWWYKLKFGTCVYGVFWNNSKENGLGDVDVRKVDLLNLFWEPEIKDIQESANIFNIAAVDKDSLVESYPFLKGKITDGATSEVVKYVASNDNGNTNDQNKVIVYDWYYKKVNDGGRTVLHYCKFVEGEVIYASENDEEYKDNGFYDHSKYPFVFDTLFPVEDSVVGFGYIDCMKSPQMYIDKLDQIVLKNAAMIGKPRFFASEGTNVNLTEFSDWSKDFVKVEGLIDETRLKQIQVNSIPAYIYNHMQMKIDELKETSGNRDFSQGGTHSGVTAASAIAALQEAGSKLSRDMIKTSYRAHRSINELVFELLRQFYTEERSFRIDGPNGEYDFMSFANDGIREMEEEDPITGELVSRKPVFDIKMHSQKQSPFSREAQNEKAKEMYGMGVFNPQMATQALAMLEMMEFEGIENIKQVVKKNDVVAQMTMQLCQLAMAMAQTVDGINQANGMMESNMIGQVEQLVSGITGQPMQEPAQAGAEEGGLPKTDNTQASKARVRVAKSAEPK
ncbi:hypothetical protein M2140_001935 [Clostridiales Family XIII bacterium PM5-7]